MPAMLRSFELAADEIIEIIEAERADACEFYRQKLLQTEHQFAAFRSSAYATHAENEAVNAQCTREIDQLLATLQQAGIYYSHGRLIYGAQWVAQGSRSSPTDVRLPLIPHDSGMGALEMQREYDVTQPFLPAANIFGRGAGRGTLAHKITNLELKRASTSQGSEPAVKRYRSSLEDAFQETKITHSAPSETLGIFGVTSTARGPSPAICTESPFTAPPVIEHWRCALAGPPTETWSPRFVLPPLVAFVYAHPCTYYLWFAIRAFLFPRMGDPRFLLERTPLSIEEWEIRLHNKRPSDASAGEIEYIYNDELFEKGGVTCVCGMPRLDATKVLRKVAALRADGTPIQAADFHSPSLQAFICTDLELAHAKLQFDQTDDIVLEKLAWTAQQRVQRAEARRDIFRNSWDASFVAVPLEMPHVLDRRPWIIRFRDILQDWPDFASIGPSPSGGEDMDPIYLESLANYEQRLIAFYLQTVSDTLGVHPARPRQRPDANTLPELYRNIVDFRGSGHDY
ncbi:hypothetical protein C8R44DRAFT_335330 [Mycena epipterygia]|nr:hypothetical protein C8R44DRAFT_335330 [Mycena epipterygia]